MSASSRVEDFLRAHVEAGDFPGASYLVAEDDRVLAEGALGFAVLRPERLAATASTVYDLASLTKPIAGALLAALLSSEERLSIDDPLSRHLRGWDPPGDAARITIGDLLTHRSGLPAWRPLYVHAAGRDQYLDRLRNLPLERPPGERVVYSDLGYILLGFALADIGGESLDRLFAKRVARPLAIPELQYRPRRSLRSRIAATEAGNRREQVLAGTEGDGYNGWRAEVAWGEVHDLNARALGGVSAHAGLFGTARAVFQVAREFLDVGKGLLDARQRRLMTTDLTRGLGEARSLGFRIASGPGGSTGGALSKRSIGHTGFTGTSLWIDPDRRRVYVLLTNRVHPEFKEIDMNAIRRGFHEVAAAL